MRQVEVNALDYVQTIAIMPTKDGEPFKTRLNTFQHDSFLGELRRQANNCIIFNADFDSLQNFANEFGFEHFVFGKKLNEDDLIWRYYKKDKEKFKHIMESYSFWETMTGGNPTYKMKNFAFSIPFFEGKEKELEDELTQKIKKFIYPLAKAAYLKSKKTD
ncbi:hypothetical protein DWQ65_08610 [Treponema phagedenis]|uniref:Uncharacterized protein n=1 Tax=Treponema phagedenis TaxID=162 RepID=A0A0B7GTN8_TREPH|nr:hypothetical protein [Treponema phagedenis]EFW36454.1 hypothetical protein HMPREF9554_03069 [Treponema phagedenis F0421]NVP24262.1 hypothetical protein [Treponema phagedenis]QEJ94235.1 hypothetical protein FUT79_02765 [Treponema phagedenis]QEJ99178.1 hypothetical protein FUT82_15055 [Treponema phagedenis]QEK00194.1 hypothetical protein FUT84_02710 [Treponema phagedenis]